MRSINETTRASDNNIPPELPWALKNAPEELIESCIRRHNQKRELHLEERDERSQNIIPASHDTARCDLTGVYDDGRLSLLQAGGYCRGTSNNHCFWFPYGVFSSSA